MDSYLGKSSLIDTYIMGWKMSWMDTSIDGSVT